MSESIQGLTSAEVAERQRQGKTNAAVTLKTKSIKRIFYDNICTLFNLINVVLFVSLLLVGSYKNLLFIGVVFFNTIIGIIQEIRSKRSVDKLTILTETKAEVLRDGKTVQIPKEELVLDDIIFLSRGNQIPADCVVVDGSCKVNESFPAASFPPESAALASRESARTATPQKSTAKPSTSRRITPGFSDPSSS